MAFLDYLKQRISSIAKDPIGAVEQYGRRKLDTAKMVGDTLVRSADFAHRTGLQATLTASPLVNIATSFAAKAMGDQALKNVSYRDLAEQSWQTYEDAMLRVGSPAEAFKNKPKEIELVRPIIEEGIKDFQEAEKRGDVSSAMKAFTKMFLIKGAEMFADPSLLVMPKTATKDSFKLTNPAKSQVAIVDNLALAKFKDHVVDDLAGKIDHVYGKGTETQLAADIRQLGTKIKTIDSPGKLYTEIAKVIKEANIDDAMRSKLLSKDGLLGMSVRDAFTFLKDPALAGKLGNMPYEAVSEVTKSRKGLLENIAATAKAIKEDTSGFAKVPSKKNNLVVYRTEEAHEAYKGKAVWGDGKYFGLNKKTVADLTIDPHSEIVHVPKLESVKEFTIPANAKIKTIDLEKLSTEEFNKLPRGNDLRKQILDEGYDGVKLLTGDDINLGGDQVIIYNEKVLPKTAAVATPKTALGGLEQEARKYKSAEEFVKAQGTPVYRGGESGFAPSKNGAFKDSGFSVARDIKTAKEYGKVSEGVIFPNAKIKQLGLVVEDIDSKIAQAKKQGFDAIEFSSYDQTANEVKEILVLNPEVIKTKSQLTDIWNKAKGNEGIAKIGEVVGGAAVLTGGALATVGTKKLLGWLQEKPAEEQKETMPELIKLPDTLPDKYSSLLVDTAEKYNLPADKFAAMIQQESSWNPSASNPESSALGLTQILNDTLNEIEKKTGRKYDRKKPEDALEAAAWYLSDIGKRIGSNDFWEIVKAYYMGVTGYLEREQPKREQLRREAEQHVESIKKYLD